VRIVADPITNSLLVKAAPLDLSMIRQLLRHTLDTDQAQEPAQTLRLSLFPLKNAPAAEVAAVLRDVYRDMEKSLHLGVVARTNTLVIRASPALEAEIGSLISKLDIPAMQK
jgi:type II secretory pathway component GspD/PulD (secretin)